MIEIVRRLFYYGDSIPRYKDEGPRLKKDDVVEFHGQVWTVEDVIEDTPDEQRLAVV